VSSPITSRNVFGLEREAKAHGALSVCLKFTIFMSMITNKPIESLQKIWIIRLLS